MDGTCGAYGGEKKCIQNFEVRSQLVGLKPR